VTEQRQDARARDLQDIRDVAVGQARQWMEEHFLALRFSERSNSLMTAASTSAQICLS
jgi:hypothetical protein